MDVLIHDMLAVPIDKNFDAAYLVDVIEHIHEEQEGQFVGNILDC